MAALNTNGEPVMNLTPALRFVISLAVLCAPLPATAAWSFSKSPAPYASMQSGDMSLELQCDRMRFAAAAYEDARDIADKQGLSIRFMQDGATESGSFQAGPENADIRIIDNYPVEILFKDKADYHFVLDQLKKNATLNLSMVDKDVSYGIFDLKGSAAAIKSLRDACGKHIPETHVLVEPPEGVVYCGGGGIKRRIEFRILDKPRDKWDARVTINGKTIRAMTAYSYFGNSAPPRNFVVALLGEDRSEFLVFRDQQQAWIEFGDYTYRPCE